jgi:ligand-binding sensor domain-containing protein
VDGNQQWTNSDQLVRALAVSPVDHIFAGTFGGVFRSTDNGDHWIAVNNGLEFPFVISLAVNQDGDVFAGTFEGVGVHRSTEDGRTGR